MAVLLLDWMKLKDAGSMLSMFLLQTAEDVNMLRKANGVCNEEGRRKEAKK